VPATSSKFIAATFSVEQACPFLAETTLRGRRLLHLGVIKKIHTPMQQQHRNQEISTPNHEARFSSTAHGDAASPCVNRLTGWTFEMHMAECPAS